MSDIQGTVGADGTRMYTVVLQEEVYKRVQIQAATRQAAMDVAAALLYDDELPGEIEGYGARAVISVRQK